MTQNTDLTTYPASSGWVQRNGYISRFVPASRANKGGKETAMSDEKLLPPGINKEESTQEPDLQKMQEQADSKDLLLPAQFNRSGKKQAQQDENADILLPTGMNK